MEKIRQALERARAHQNSSNYDDLALERRPAAFDPAFRTPRDAAPVGPLEPHAQVTELKSNLLQSQRIVSYDGKDQRSRPYDMLRTQVLQSMDANGWKVLGVTSPTPGCGKTLTAINLGFSVARQPDRSVMLMDLDLQRPRLSDYFGIAPRNEGTLGVLKERATLGNVTVPILAGNQELVVIPTLGAKESAELMSSRQMGNLLRDLRNDFQIVILDLPPILSSDDVIALLPQIDCVLLVAAVGLTKASDIEECVRHLQQSQLVRVVLNKAGDTDSTHYYY